jgi:hypothetical protein
MFGDNKCGGILEQVLTKICSKGHLKWRAD